MHESTHLHDRLPLRRQQNCHAGCIDNMMQVLSCMRLCYIVFLSIIIFGSQLFLLKCIFCTWGWWVNTFVGAASHRFDSFPFPAKITFATFSAGLVGSQLKRVGERWTAARGESDNNETSLHMHRGCWPGQGKSSATDSLESGHVPSGRTPKLKAEGVYRPKKQGPCSSHGWAGTCLRLEWMPSGAVTEGPFLERLPGHSLVALALELWTLCVGHSGAFCGGHFAELRLT